ncbi:MAG: DUF3488 domain-containing transglutaminase family protein [Geobacteraceae bacterium]|nr:DUF3488 domain-containing transglutaminase family protein [Geobacteraceae bacterium]
MFRIRNILSSLLCLAAVIGYLPLASYLGAIPKVAIPLAIIFAFFAERKELALKERYSLILSIAAFLFYALQFNRHNVVQPAVEMLAIFLAIRLVGEKSPRNFMQSLTLAMFCLAGSTLFDLSPGFVFYLIALLFVFTVSMVLLTFQSRAAAFEPDSRELRSIISVALLQPLVAAPLIIFLFFILPRTQLPVWHGLTRAGADRSGISESVKAGDKGSISTGSSVVFRAETKKLLPNQLYWRAIVLNSIKNDEWIRQTPPPEKSTIKDGKNVSLNIFLEPGRIPFLPTLNRPERIIGYRGQPHDDRVFPAPRLTGGLRSYQILAKTDATLSTIGSFNKKFYLQPPANTPERLKSLVARAVTGIRENKQKLDAIENIFAKMNLSYASSGLPTGANALENFLFDAKKGHCELFAISFATALRLAGLPSRLVGGYYGGDYNELAGYYVISEEKAHVWVEVWIDGSGWITVDPSRFAVNFEESVSRKRTDFSLKMRLALDSLSYYWNKAVITYDFESQLSAAVRVSQGFQGIREIRFNLRKAAPYLALPLLLALLFMLLTTKRKTPEERLLAKFKRVTKARYGILFSPSSGLHEAVAHLDNADVREFVATYTAAIYRDRKLTEAEIEQLSETVRRIRKTPPV